MQLLFHTFNTQCKKEKRMSKAEKKLESLLSPPPHVQQVFVIRQRKGNKSETEKTKLHVRALTLQFSGGTMSWVMSPPWTQKMCFISPVKMSQTMTEKSTPPETSERWS